MAAQSNKKKTKQGRARKAPAASATSPWGYSLLAIVGGVAGVIAALLLTLLQVINPASERAGQAEADRVADAIAAQLNGRLANLRVDVDALAESDLVVNALTRGDAQVQSGVAAQLTAATGYAQRIDIIPKGRAAVDLSSDVPISFAALAAIKRAEESPWAGPEVALNQRSVFYVARPITHLGSVAGTLFVVMSNSYLNDGLTLLDPGAGLLQINQRFEGESGNVIIEHGSAGEASFKAVRSLDANGWSLTYAANPASAAGGSLLDLLTPLAVGLALALAGAYLAFSRLFRKLDADADVLSELAERRLAGRAPRMHQFNLAAFKQAALPLLGGAASRQEDDSDEEDNEPVIGDADDLLLDDEPEPAAPAAKAKARPAKTKSTAESAAAAADDFLDISDEDEDNFGIEVVESDGGLDIDLDETIFRAYDIRGVVTNNLTEEVVYWVGRAFAAESLSKDASRVAIGRDGRHSSPLLRDALARGLTEGGVDVIDIGEVPTPLLYYATHALDTGTGVMITGSHNPPEYNGLKMLIAGETLAEERIQGLKQRLLTGDLSEGAGEVETVELTDHYVDRVLDDIAIAQPLKVVVDCGNGVAGKIAPKLIRELGCEVIELYCDVDGDFPNHHPDPADPKNLQDLITVVAAEQADLGLAFDGDGDRVGVVTNFGSIVWPDKLMMLFSRDIIGRNPGADIIYDVKCSRHLNALISEYGGRPIMWKTGHSHIKAKIKQTGALLGGEFSGHICFGERWYGFDDALYSAARLLEILSAETIDAESVFAEFPMTVTTPEIKINTTDTAKFEQMKLLASKANFGDGAITDIDGIRVDYEDGWGLIRPSNTSPVLTLRFEADDQAGLDRIVGVFREQLTAVDPSLTFNV